MRLGIAVVPISLWASWAAWRGPPPNEALTTPSPLPREASAEAQAEQQAVASALTARIRAALAHGPVPLSALSAEDSPILGAPLPDNPLVPGVGHVIEHCDHAPSLAEADWFYCARTGEIRPGMSQ